MSAVILRRLPVGVFVQVMVVVADHAVYGDAERGELRFHAGEQLWGVPYDVAEQNRGLGDAPGFFRGGFRLQHGDDFRAQPFEMRFGFGLGVGDGQQFVIRFGAGPRQQFEIVTLCCRIIGAVKLGDALRQGGQVSGRGHEADEQRLVIGIERE